MRPIFPYALRLLGILLAPPLLTLIVLTCRLPITSSGALYLLVGSLLVLGLIAFPLSYKQSLKLIFAGVLGFCLVIAARSILMGQNPSSEIRMVTLPEGHGPRWLGSIIDEQDALIFGEELFHIIGGDSTREHEGLVPAFEAAYSEMRTQGIYPSPIISTYLNLQQPDAFDAVIIQPREQPTFGVIFLHGFMGNVTAQCWEIAQAVKDIGGMTVCPSTEWTGQWSEPRGHQILKRTFEYLRKQGITRFYLGGFSNGGFSMGRLASELGNESGLVGLFFIDGFTNGTGVRGLGLPVLIIEGMQDERVPPAMARQFAAEVGELGTYVEIDSDHFLIVKKPEEIENAIHTWLNGQMNP